MSVRLSPARQVVVVSQGTKVKEDCFYNIGGSVCKTLTQGNVAYSGNTSSLVELGHKKRMRERQEMKINSDLSFYISKTEILSTPLGYLKDQIINRGCQSNVYTF